MKMEFIFVVILRDSNKSKISRMTAERGFPPLSVTGYESRADGNRGGIVRGSINRTWNGLERFAGDVE